MSDKVTLGHKIVAGLVGVGLVVGLLMLSQWYSGRQPVTGAQAAVAPGAEAPVPPACQASPLPTTACLTGQQQPCDQHLDLFPGSYVAMGYNTGCEGSPRNKRC